MNNHDEMKQVIVIRKDLHMRQGKACSMAAHASMKAIIDSSHVLCDSERYSETKGFIYDENSYIDKWLSSLFTKVTVRIESEEDLLYIYNRVAAFNSTLLNKYKVPIALIEDSGLTEFNGVETITCACIGPWFSKKIDEYTGKLKLL